VENAEIIRIAGPVVAEFGVSMEDVVFFEAQKTSSTDTRRWTMYVERPEFRMQVVVMYQWRGRDDDGASYSEYEYIRVSVSGSVIIGSFRSYLPVQHKHYDIAECEWASWEPQEEI
jgi:hypothetical protein